MPQSVIIEKSILLWYNKLINIGGAAVERVYAFTDESGAFGWDLDNPSVSSHFIIAAIIVKESDLEIFTQKAEALRKNISRQAKSNRVKSVAHMTVELESWQIYRGFLSIFSPCVLIKKYVRPT